MNGEYSNGIDVEFINESDVETVNMLFIDGLNGLLLGYYLLVLAALLQSDSQILGFLKSDDLVYFSTFLLIFLIFNFFNLFFLGDNGAYLLGFIISFILIL